MRKECDFSKLKELKNPYARKKKAVGINLSPEVVDYFKRLAEETGLPYQKLIFCICWTARGNAKSWQ
jgi:predicted DNA binding CopG/RHH family protein